MQGVAERGRMAIDFNIPGDFGRLPADMGIGCAARFRVNYPHSLIPLRFVLASGASLKGESDESPKVSLICVRMLFERNRGSRSVSDNA